MTWRDISDELSNQWKKLVDFQPELSVDLLQKIGESSRYADIEIQQYSIGGQIENPAKDVRAELFLRFDVALQYISEQDPSGKISASRDATLYWLLDHVWYKYGLPSIRETILEND